MEPAGARQGLTFEETAAITLRAPRLLCLRDGHHGR